MRYAEDIPYQPSEAIQALNEDLLRQHLRYCAEHSPFYQRRFSEMGIGPDDFRGMADLQRFPLTIKEDLEREGDAFLAVPEAEVVDACQTSGTTGKPVVMYQTAHDLERLGYNEAISFRMAGMTADDRVLIACALGRCFMAGLAYFEGTRRVGAMAIRTGAENPAMLAESVLTHRPTMMIAVPSTALAVARVLQERGHSPESMGLKACIAIGEPVRRPDLGLNALGVRLAEAWNTQVLGTYASTEMATSFPDCAAGCGGHLHPELIAIELLDDAGDAVPPGCPGEIVATPLQVTGMPLLRLRTGDIAAFYDAPCACGRNTPRLGPILGRKQHMLKIHGTTIYPAAVHDALNEIAGMRHYYLEVFKDYDLSDRLRVTVGLAPNCELTASAIAERLRDRIRLKPEVRLSPPEEVERFTIKEGKRKPIRFFDYRGQPFGRQENE